jgi:hypothetical protein
MGRLSIVLLAVGGFVGMGGLAGCGDDTMSDGSPQTAQAGGGGASGVAGGAGLPTSGSGAGGGAGNAGAAAGSSGAGGAGAGANGGSGAGGGSVAGRGGSGGSGGDGGGGAQAGSGGAGSGGSGTGGTAGSAGELERFSFFVTSMEGMIRLAKSDKGFGGDLRYGEATGLEGADKICTELAESSMPGSGAKQWRAFLSIVNGPGGQPVHAINRIGEGPWYDRRGRLFAMTKDDLKQSRPRGADPAIINDLPNEDGVPNKTPDPAEGPVDNHHVLTGSNAMGELYGPTATCDDWESLAREAGRPRIGFSWPIQNRQHWISGQDEGGCGAGIVITDGGGSNPNNPIVGSGGGYGGIYCFALTP